MYASDEPQSLLRDAMVGNGFDVSKLFDLLHSILEKEKEDIEKDVFRWLHRSIRCIVLDAFGLDGPEGFRLIAMWFPSLECFGALLHLPRGDTQLSCVSSKTFERVKTYRIGSNGSIYFG